MKTVKGQFIFHMTDEIVVDLGEISENTWSGIKENVRVVMAANQTDEIGMAYIAAFIMYLAELDMMSIPYDSKVDLFN